jgi:glutathione synthase/RimK-type ligase-like ATP-grasp enzyme
VLLLVTNSRDITSDYIVLELQRRGVTYGRLNTEDLVSAQSRWRYTPAASGWALHLHNQWIEVTEIKAAYLRRPVPPILKAGLGAGERRYAITEWGALLDNVCAHLSGRWLNEPAAVARAENKTLQIAIANQVGFSVPETLLSNNLDAIASFMAEHESIVAKPLRSGLIKDREGVQRVAFTTRLDELVTSEDQAAVEAVPFMVQREIRKRCDVRVTVIGERVFAAEIDSQAYAGTAVDWRRGAASDLKHASHELPSTVAGACLRLVDRLGLRFGAVDLIQDRVGEYWFLEINPNGQWAWIEAFTGLPIAAALVDEMIKVART